MVVVEKGYCLASFKQGESNLICHLLTQEGLKHFLVRGAFKPKAKIRNSLFFPLAFIECSLQNSTKSELLLAKEVSLENPAQLLQTTLAGKMQLLFMGEIALIAAKQGADQELWGALQSFHISFFTEENPNKHLVFLLKIISLLGILPREVEEKEKKTGLFSAEEKQLFSDILSRDFFVNKKTKAQRNAALFLLLRYIQHFYPPFSSLKSHQVLIGLF